MYKRFVNQSFGVALTLTMALSVLPATVLAAQEDGLCEHHTAHTEQCGYAEDRDCTFAVNGCEECEAAENLITIIGTDVTIDGYSFPYTGEEIKPTITVKVGDTLLEEGKHYQLTYKDNVEAGTASVTVTGMEEAGYNGIVTIEFTITPVDRPEDTDKPEDNEKPEDTDKPEDSDKPGDAGDENQKEEETKPAEYKITGGSGTTWYQGSGKVLSFTADGKFADFTGISVNGKSLGKSYFTAKEGTTVTLTKEFLNKLAVGKYTVTIHFADGDAEGTFLVSDKLDTSNPVTGDAFPIGFWMAAGALAALGGAAVLMKKKAF